jgi:hypothetical protein
VVAGNEIGEMDASSFNNTGLMQTTNVNKVMNPTSNATALSHFKDAASKSAQKFSGGSIQVQSHHTYIMSLQAVSLDLEQKMTAREKEIDLLSNQN